jgi:hypothetical protein
VLDLEAMFFKKLKYKYSGPVYGKEICLPRENEHKETE